MQVQCRLWNHDQIIIIISAFHFISFRLSERRTYVYILYHDTTIIKI